MSELTPGILSAQSAADVITAATMLRNGAVLVIPTDTVYGLAASIFRNESVSRIFEIKLRDVGKRLPILISTAVDLSFLAASVSRTAWKLIDAFWPGPLTLVLPAGDSVPSSVTLGSGSLAVRVPAARSCLSVLQVLGEPIIGTSANLSGMPPAITAQQALHHLGASIDGVLVDDDAIRSGISSTLVEPTETYCTIHRVGAVSADDVRGMVGPKVQVRVPFLSVTGLSEENKPQP